MTNYRCIVTLSKGHKVLRMTRDVVAHMVSEYRRMQGQLFRSTVSVVVGGESLLMNDVKKMLFINEWTGERLEIA